MTPDTETRLTQLARLDKRVSNPAVRDHIETVTTSGWPQPYIYLDDDDLRCEWPGSDVVVTLDLDDGTVCIRGLNGPQVGAVLAMVKP